MRKVSIAKTQVVRPTPSTELSERYTMTLAGKDYAGAATEAAWTIETSEDVSNNYYGGHANWYEDWGDGGINDRDWDALQLIRLEDIRYIFTSTSYGLINFAPSNIYTGGAFMGATGVAMGGGTGTLELGIRINNTANFFKAVGEYHIADTGTAPDPTLYSTATSFPGIGESSLIIVDEIVAENYAAISALDGELYISGLAWRWTVSKSLNTYTADWEPNRGKQSFYLW